MNGDTTETSPRARTAVFNLTATFTPEESGFVVYCPELDITTEGDTFEEACEFLEDAITAYVEIVGSEQILKDAPQILTWEEGPGPEGGKPGIVFGAFTLDLKAFLPMA